MLRTIASLAAVLAAGLVMLASPADATRKKAAPAPKPDRFSSPEAIQHWMKGYRAAPNPALLPAAVKAMSRLGVFREVENAGIYFGFAAGVIGSNSKLADKLLAEMFPLPPEDQIVVVRAVAWSGIPEWKAIMARIAERMPARAVLIDRYGTGKLPGLMELPLDESPYGIDALWGYYYATGSQVPIKRLIATLAWSTDTQDADRLTAGNMVKLTLAVNATRDVDLMSILKRQATNQPKATARPLAEVIEAAETYETARIRKDALAAINELKTKGSSTKRNVSFWGQVGTTALALGCVAASALGQVQIGIPCVVGGAGASAALRMYTIEK